MIRINLAPPERRRGGRGFEFRLPELNLGLLIGAVYGVAVLVLLLYWLSLSSRESRILAALERDQKELATLKVQLGPAARIKELVVEMQKRLATIEQLTKNQTRPILLLDAFLDAVPPDLWLTSLEEKGAVLRINGTAFSTTAVSDFMTNLRRSGKFKEVDITVAKQDINKSPRPVTFEVTCRFEI